MANVSAAATVWNCPNYTGELYLIGANKTPFLNMIGGLAGTGVRTVGDFQYPLAQPWSLEAPAQPNISETASLTAPTALTYVRGQDVNTCQIWQRRVSVSYAKQSVAGQVTADANTGLIDIGDNQPVANEKDFQINAHMRQIAVDVDYTFLNGIYTQSLNAGQAARTRGIITGAVTNTVDASAATLDKPLIDQLLRTMAGNGSEFLNPVIFCGAYQKQRFSSIYGYAPEDRNVGGVNIKQIETDFAILGIIWAPNVPAGSLLIADVAFCSPVFLPVPEKGVLFYEELSKTGASEIGRAHV